MPGRKKGRQRGSAGSKSQRARRWDDALRDARDDLANDRRAKVVRGGDSAPPTLSAQGYRSLTTFLTQRLRADRADEVAAIQSVGRAGFVESGVRRAGSAAGTAHVSKPNPRGLEDRRDNRPRKTRSLTSLCISQVGNDFAAYRSEDEDVAAAFRLLPDVCLSRLSRAASARGTICDHNLALLCSPGVTSLWLRGRFSDQGAAAVLPALREASNQETSGQDDERPCCNGAGANLAEPMTSEGKRTTTNRIAETQEVPWTESFHDGGRANKNSVNVSTIEGKDDSTFAAGTKEKFQSSVGGGDGLEEDWETAGDRIQASLRGGLSLTSLDVSSPLISADYVKRLVIRIPSLRRLGLRGSLGVVGGPSAVCDHVPRLAALRELDVSRCSWFCDLCLRRFASALARGRSSITSYSTATCNHSGTTLEHMALEHADETTSDWGAASATGGRIAFDNTLPYTGVGLGLGGNPSLICASDGRVAREPRTVSCNEGARQFGMFALVCAETAVTQKGAKAAEAIAPGLLVLADGRSEVADLHLAL